MRSLISLLLLLLLNSVTFAGGGWVYEAKTGYFQVSQRFIVADQVFGPDGSLQPLFTTANYTTSLYGEYGLTDWLNGIVYAPIFVRNTINEVQGRQTGNTIQEGGAFNGIGDLDLGLKFRLLKTDKFALAGTVRFGIPTGNTSNDLGLFTGDGEFNQLFLVDAGATILGGGWLSVGGGYNFRSRGFSDEWQFRGEIGAAPGRWILIAKLNGILSTFNGDENVTSDNTALFANNTEFVSFGPEVGFRLTEKWGLQANVFFASLGRNILAAPSTSVGVFYNLTRPTASGESVE